MLAYKLWDSYIIMKNFKLLCTNGLQQNNLLFNVKAIQSNSFLE